MIKNLLKALYGYLKGTKDCNCFNCEACAKKYEKSAEEYEAKHGPYDAS